MKYQVHYERTVQVRRYETLKIGLFREYDDQEVPFEVAFEITRHEIDDKITRTLRDLRK